MRMSVLSVGVGILIVSAFGQTPTTQLNFEVTSIRPAAPLADGERPGVVETFTEHQLTFRNAQIVDLVRAAFGLEFDQILGPEELWGNRYDVTAKLPPDTTKEQSNIMLRNLVAERSELTLHHVVREVPQYELTVAAGGHKLIENPNPAVKPSQSGKSSFQAVPFSTFVRLLKMTLATSVDGHNYDLARLEDHTGLTGKYDFTLQFAGTLGVPTFFPLRVDATMPEIFQALERQLGLKLTRTTIMLDAIVIDHIESIATDGRR